MTWTYIPSTNTEYLNRHVIELVSGTTENDLSGLVGVTGVTHYINKSHIDVYEIAEDTKLVIRGTLYHDPDKEILILHHTNKSMRNVGSADPPNYQNPPNSQLQSALSISGGASNPAYYYYGTTRTNSTAGTSTNSTSTGLLFVGERVTNWHPGDASMSGGGGNAHFIGRGGVISTGRPMNMNCELDVVGTAWKGTTGGLEWRNNFGTSTGSSFDGKFDNYNVLLPAFTAKFNITAGSIGEVINQGNITYHTLRDFDTSNNVGDYDVGVDGQKNQNFREWEVINSGAGSSVRQMWRNTRGSGGQRGVLVTKKEISFNITNASGQAIDGVKLYSMDTPSSFAKHAIFEASKSYNAAGFSGSADSQITRGVTNANGDRVYDYTTPEIYQETADSSGNIATFEVVTGVQIMEYTTNDTDGAGEYGIHVHNGTWRFSSSNLRGAAYTDWDTDNFSRFYKVDRRSDSNTDSDDFTFCLCSYNHLLASTTRMLKGVGELEVDWLMFLDRSITQTSKASVDAYAEIDTPAKFYDRAKSYLYDNYAGELETIVDISGTTIAAGYKDVVVTNDSQAAVFTYQKNTPSDLTSASGLTVTAVGTGTPNSNHPPSRIIDDNTTDNLNKWLITNHGSDSGVQITGFDSSLVTSLKITSSDVQSRDPASYELYGSNDASNWTLINSADIKRFTARKQTHTFYFKNSERYTSYKILFPTRVDTSQTTLAVQEIELVGVTIEGTITAKAETYTGNITTTGGSITLESGAQIVGTYGDISVLPYTLTNIEAGSTVQLYNVESGSEAEIANFVVGGTAGTKVTYTGTYANSLAEPGDEIRLRVTCQSGTAALLPYEAFGVAQSSGISFKVNQQADTIYNSNGIDGSSTAITDDFTADYTNLQIDSTETDGVVTVQEIYAFYAYIVTTTEGIQNFFGAITPVDAMNYRINTSVVNLKIQNTTSIDTILKGGRLYRDDNTSVIDTNSSTGAGVGSFTHDTGFLLQYITPQVESALSSQVASASDMTTVKNNVASIKSNTGLIPGLL